MAKTINITNNDLKTLINEVVRKLSFLNESMKEGGAAGHMMHPYDVDTFTFADYKQLVRDLFETRIERYSEKLDGMNIFATVSEDGQARFARKSADIKNPEGGMDPAGIAERWGSDGKDPMIYAAYENAYKLFMDVVKKIPNPVEFFNGPGYRIYANCEVIDQRHPNVIDYPILALSFHGLAAFTNDGTGKEVDLPDEIFDQKMAVLERLMPDVKSEYGHAQITPEAVIEIRENCQNLIDEYCAYIDRIVEMAGVNENTTIIDYRAKLLPVWMKDHGYGDLLNTPFSEYFLKRWVYNIKEPTLSTFKKQMRQQGYSNCDEFCNRAAIFEQKYEVKGPLGTALKEIMEPVEMFFYRLGNEVIARCTSHTNTGREQIVLDGILKRLEDTKKMVAEFDDLGVQQEMAYWLRKLSELDFKYNAMEGVVFKYRGNTLKLTGTFAALNRAVNMRIAIGRIKSNREKNQVQ